MSIRHYDFHGVTLEIDSEVEAVAEAIDGRLRDFRSHAGDEPSWRYELTLVEEGADHAIERPSGDARAVYDPPAGELVYFAAEDALWIDYEDRVRVHASPNRAAVSVRAGAANETWLLSRPLFTIPFVDALKRHGLYGLHAAAVARDEDRAVLLPGSSGSGKSTLAVALALGGWGFMSDDMLFLTYRGGRLTALAFPDEVDLTEETAAWFPDLRVPVGAPPDGWPKHRLRIDEAIDAATVMSSSPAALIFPAIGGAEASTLRPVRPEEALLELAPNVLLTDPRSSQAHLDAIAELSRGVSAHRLTAALDFERIGDLLATAVGRVQS